MGTGLLLVNSKVTGRDGDAYLYGEEPVQSCPTVYLYIPADVMWRTFHVTIDEE